MSDFIRQFVPALVLTIVIETAVAYVMGVRKSRDYLLIILANIMTNVSLNYLHLVLFKFWGTSATLLMYMAGELMVVCVEYMIYKRHLESPVDPLKLAAVSNVISFTGGLLWKSYL